MFGSYLIELVVGLCFLFAVLGIVTSAVTEAALSVLQTRATHLKEWLEQWARQLAPGAETATEAGAGGEGRIGLSLEALQQHPLVASHQRGDEKASYLPPDQLASALLQTLAMPFSQGCVGQDLPTAEKALRRHIDGLNGQGLRQALHALLNDAVSQAADGTALVEALKTQTTTWIDDSMSRIEGWTKRHAKKISLAVALLICLAFNVNALEVMRALSADPQLRTQMAATAVAYVPKVCDDDKAANADQRIECLRTRTQDAVDALGPLTRLGIGWDAKPAFLTAADPWRAMGHFGVWLIGIACAAFAASLGGDFWFKWIGDIVRLTGYKPRPKDEPRASTVVVSEPTLLQRFTGRR